MARRPRVIGRWIKRQMPKTLFGRSLLIIVLPVAIMQIAVTYVFFDAHWETVTSRLSEGLAGDVAWAVESYQDDPSAASFAKISKRAEDSMGLSVALQPGRTLPDRTHHALFAPIDQSMQQALSGRLDQPFWFDTVRYPAYVDIRVAVHGGVMRILAPRDRAFATQGHIFVLWMTVATVLLTAIAILFIRNQVKAIERLANAAEAFGRGGDVPSFKPQGAREVRREQRRLIKFAFPQFHRMQRHGNDVIPIFIYENRRRRAHKQVSEKILKPKCVGILETMNGFQHDRFGDDRRTRGSEK